MGDVFPELTKNPQHVADLIREEEESFGRTLDRGIELFNEAAQHGSNRIAAAEAFKLHDTYGFPLDLTQVMAAERGMTVDVEGFNQLMAQARRKARGTTSQVDPNQFMIDILQQDKPPATEFIGYEQTEATIKTFCLIYRFQDGQCTRVKQAASGDECMIVVGRTPFYGESGGQVGDSGEIHTREGGVFRVHSTRKSGDVYFHTGVMEKGTFTEHKSNDASPVELTLRVDSTRRQKIMANHTATHLMNRALRAILGDHVQQKGSLVDDEKLRFDFSHNSAISDEQLERVENIVNNDIGADLPVYTQYAPQEQALKIHGLRAVFGEKYPPKVRVVSIGVPLTDLLADPVNKRWHDYSLEFCGGTHLAKTGDAEGFVVVTEEAVAKGVRRITALTSRAAHQASAKGDMLLGRIEGLQSQPPETLPTAIADLMEAIANTPLPLLAKSKLREGAARLQNIVKEYDKQRNKQVAGSITDTARKLADECTGNLLVSAIDDADSASLRTAMDVIRKKRPDAAMLLAAAPDGKTTFLAAVPQILIDRGLKAGDWVREVARVAGGSGGGRPDMAQAGGKDPSKLLDALEAGRQYAQSKL
jgi:alanyl-tRNA synthetase